MAGSESLLLEQFVKGDREAFCRIVQRYGGMVYGTSLRVLGDADEAADATQETFFQLLRNAGSVGESVGGWLHRVATRKAIDMIRRASKRRRREAAYAQERVVTAEKWEDVSGQIDGAIEELGEESRAVLVGHYLEGRSMVQLAEEMGVSQPTISRRMGAGLEQLRGKLKSRGVAAGSAVLGGILLEKTASAAPAGVMGELLKMAMVGGTAAGPAVAGGGAVAAGVNVKIAAAVVAVAVGIGGIAVYQNVRTDQQEGAARNSVKVNTSVSAEGNRAVSGAASSGREIAVPEEGGFGNVSDWEMGAARSAGARSAGRDAGARGSAEVGSATGTGDGGSATETSDAAAGEDQGGSKVNLTSPEQTVESFMNLLEAGDLESLGECFVDGAEDYGDLRRIMEEPATEEEAQFGMCLRSLGGPVEIVESLDGVDGLEVKWVCTVKVDFSFGGITWGRGDKFELDGRLVQVEGQWKVAGI